jgi:hypothetical protein
MASGDSTSSAQANSGGGAPGGPFDVFICFARPSGLAAAQALRGALAQANIRAFVDARDLPPGHPWDGLVRSALRDAKVTVVCVGPELSLSVHAQAEVDEVIDWAGAPGGRRLIVPWVLPGAPQMTHGPAGLHAYQVIDGGPAAVVAAVVAWMGPTRPAPPWASAAGVDHLGRWAEFEVAGGIQRLRWIEPGRFVMGSPRTEAGRNSGEGPQHEVTLSHGYWMGDTPVTQALYLGVMGKRPSYFTRPADRRRPVEQVSWDDAVRFTRRLAALRPSGAPDDGLVFQLPTEAQWEHACRAGTTTPTYSPEGKGLDDIAWTASNAKQSTQRVGQLLPNAWGLFDTLGNVWEWCADHSIEYPDGPRTDPLGAGPLRASRGGAWAGDALSARAACRDAIDPSMRCLILGFRLSRGRAHPPLQPDQAQV